MWVRGLKLTDYEMETAKGLMSHPMWVRGLKLKQNPYVTDSIHVAPYVGAWIETSVMRSWLDLSSVAPYVGAWIETTWSWLWSNV